MRQLFRHLMSRSANASVLSSNKIANRFTCLGAGDVLDDYPDSPGSAPQLSGEAASRLLDADDTGMDLDPASRRKPRALGTPSSVASTRAALSRKASRALLGRLSRLFTIVFSGKGLIN
jgi:hypothetical protein